MATNRDRWAARAAARLLATGEGQRLVETWDDRDDDPDLSHLHDDKFWISLPHDSMSRYIEARLAGAKARVTRWGNALALYQTTVLIVELISRGKPPYTTDRLKHHRHLRRHVQDQLQTVEGLSIKLPPAREVQKKIGDVLRWLIARGIVEERRSGRKRYLAVAEHDAPAQKGRANLPEAPALPPLPPGLGK